MILQFCEKKFYFQFIGGLRLFWPGGGYIHVEFDFEAIKRFKIAKCDIFFKRVKNGKYVFS